MRLLVTTEAKSYDFHVFTPQTFSDPSSQMHGGLSSSLPHLSFKSSPTCMLVWLDWGFNVASCQSFKCRLLEDTRNKCFRSNHLSVYSCCTCFLVHHLSDPTEPGSEPVMEFLSAQHLECPVLLPSFGLQTQTWHGEWFNIPCTFYRSYKQDWQIVAYQAEKI